MVIERHRQMDLFEDFFFNVSPQKATTPNKYFYEENIQITLSLWYSEA